MLNLCQTYVWLVLCHLFLSVDVSISLKINYAMQETKRFFFIFNICFSKKWNPLDFFLEFLQGTKEKFIFQLHICSIPFCHINCLDKFKTAFIPLWDHTDFVYLLE